MTSRFECRFAVGANGLAYSGVWLVFTAKTKPDLYIAVKNLSGALKATVHCPRPPEHPNYGRHFGFVNEANDALANAVRKDGSRHIVTWTGYRYVRRAASPAFHHQACYGGVNVTGNWQN